MNLKRANKLINEKSPYLLQHAYNPVEWHPWGEEAFEKAKKEDKAIFLSIGYSTCHWCHVMERESFEDTEVAELLNSDFVSIKVDREERPDIDSVYMTVCQAMTGSGGWPLTIIMTPEKKPFFAATYIPKKGRFGRTGMLELLPAIKDYWIKKRTEVLESAEKIQGTLQSIAPKEKDEKLGKEILALAYTQLLKRFDEKDGGFSGAPKFPTPHNLIFLLRYWKRTGAEKALQMVEKTLQSMRQGGIFDHIGFGFHRYSTDDFWLVPHFEKMLYDQALLIIAYTEAYQATKKKEYENVVREIISYVLREMTSPTGGFYSAEDADSLNEGGEMEEGAFYLWKEQELKEILTKEELELISKIFNIKGKGNYLEQATQERTGKNILHLTAQIVDSALKKRIEEIRLNLFTFREKRKHPHKDDKLLVSWNGLMIAALAKAARVFNELEYENVAEKAVQFIFKNMLDSNKRLLHRYRDGDSAIKASLDDYAFLIWALLELYETTFNETYLVKALTLHRDLMEHFWDEEGDGFYFTPDDGEELFLRLKEIYDGAIPSGNSVEMWNLVRLEQITGDSKFGEMADKLVSAFTRQVIPNPSVFTQLMVALEFALGTSYQIVIAGNKDADDTKAMIKAVDDLYLPNKVILFNPVDKSYSEIHKIATFLKEQPSIENKATAYVCINSFCKKPVTSVEEMLKQLELI